MFHVFRRWTALLGAGGVGAMLLLAPAAAPAEGAAKPPRRPPRVSGPPPRHGRETKVIDDGWTFRADPTDSGEAHGWTKAAAPDSVPVAVPSLWASNVPPDYTGAAWYWRTVDPPGAWLGQTVRLRFEAVAERAQVWLNGELIGEHVGGATPFEFNVTKPLKIGAKNLLAVRVEGSAKRGAGIWQGVMLMAHDEAYIADIFPYAGPLGNLVAEVELYNTSDKSGDSELDAHVLPADKPGPDIKKSAQNLSLTPKRNVTTFVINVPQKRVAAWSPESPALFNLDLVFHQDKDVLDTAEATFGFRELGWKEGAITINGVAIAPKAIAPELARPVVIATDEDRPSAAAMLRRLKEAGVNVVYLDAPPPALLQIADAQGLLVVEGARRGLPGPAAAQELLDLVRRDRSHPSILAWSVPALTGDTASSARTLDPTRFLIARTAAAATLLPPHSDEPATAPAGLVPR
jgi:beta-galactosidase/beta-glucuronidase